MNENWYVKKGRPVRIRREVWRRQGRRGEKKGKGKTEGESEKPEGESGTPVSDSPSEGWRLEPVQQATQQPQTPQPGQGFRTLIIIIVAISFVVAIVTIVLVIAQIAGLGGPDQGGGGTGFRSCIASVFGNPPECSDVDGGDGTPKDTLLNGRDIGVCSIVGNTGCIS